MSNSRKRDRKFESTRRRLHAMLRTLEWAKGEHCAHAHKGLVCPDVCLETRLANARLNLLRQIIKEFGGRV